MEGGSAGRREAGHPLLGPGVSPRAPRGAQEIEGEPTSPQEGPGASREAQELPAEPRSSQKSPEASQKPSSSQENLTGPRRA